MKIVIRADASREIGNGHVVRCLTLADKLRQRGAEITFVCRDQPGDLVDFILQKGFRVVRLQAPEKACAVIMEDPPHAAWLAVPWQQDAEETLAACSKDNGLDWLIVDHYALDWQWEQRLRPHVRRIMVIDDLADRPHDCDLLLDQNFYKGMESRYNGLVPSSCQQLLGPRYALLRPEFIRARNGLRQRDGVVRRVLVFFGGVDASNETIKVLQALQDQRGGDGLSVDVVVGTNNPQKEAIRTFCARNGFTYHCQIDNMAELMAAADLAIGGGGTSTWERCALGLPSLVKVLADNQRELAQNASQAGLCFLFGDAACLSPQQFDVALQFALQSPAALQHLSEQCLMMVDARGCDRLVSLLFPPLIRIRRASLGDCDAVYKWRNSEETRRVTFDAAPIPFESHMEWYRSVLGDPDRLLLIGEVDGEPVGVLRYDLAGDEALISVYLVPGMQGKGNGAELIRCGSHWLRQHYPGIAMIRADILPGNITSQHAFKAAGYVERHLVYYTCLHLGG